MEKNASILVVDDDKEIADLVEIYLVNDGYQVLKASDGEQCLETLKQHPEVRMLILDIMMPGIDGLEVCREIRKTSNIPILILSAKAEDMDKIVTQGKELGTYLYFMTGGEPTVRKADILKLAEKHNDCMFALFSNSTLIDEELCQKIVELGNITFLLSIEGTPETNDSRRGNGHYEAVMKAMDLLKKYGIVFGTSIKKAKFPLLK